MAIKYLLSCLIILMMFSSSRTDFTGDKKLCQEQLVKLSPCLNFVSGDAKAPSPACCTELQRDVDNSKFCLCLLIRDRNEPSLGFKLNATRALSLDPLCQTHSNSTICPKLLHLPPNSPEAQVFEQFGNTTSVGVAAETATSSSVKLATEAAIIAILVWTISVQLLEYAA